MTHHLTRAVTRLGTGLTVGVIVAALAAMRVEGEARTLITMLAGYSGFAAAYLLLTGFALLRATAAQLRRHAATDDPARGIVLFVIVAGSAGVVAAALYLLRGTLGDASATPLLVLTLLNTVLAWLVTHAAYGLHYAHLHYIAPTKGATDRGGFQFPGSDDPDGLDFAYLAFTIGMTFQVSDTQAAHRSCRRAILWHALLSFAYNTLLVAMVVNAALSLAQRSH